jgi:hypothetical protein
MSLLDIAKSQLSSLAQKAKAVALKVSDVELKVLEATNHDSWGPHGQTMSGACPARAPALALAPRDFSSWHELGRAGRPLPRAAAARHAAKYARVIGGAGCARRDRPAGVRPAELQGNHGGSAGPWQLLPTRLPQPLAAPRCAAPPHRPPGGCDQRRPSRRRRRRRPRSASSTSAWPRAQRTGAWCTRRCCCSSSSAGRGPS